MRIIKTKNYDEMSLAAADFIGAQVLIKPDCVLGLATGSSPVGAYRILAERVREGRLSFSEVRTVNLDEYLGLPADHEQSYARFMKENLFSHIDIDLKNTNVPSGIAPDPLKECKAYDELIESLGGIDLQLLGIGHNGHIGFNEPDDNFPAGTHKVKLTESTIAANTRFFEKSEDVPTHALTMGIRDIMLSKRILVVASGEGKAQAVRDLVCGPITPRMPASILQLHPNCVLIADAPALSLIR